MLTSGPALQIIRQQPSGVQAVREFARRYNRSVAQLQELMQFDFGVEPAGVTDRLIAFEILIGEYGTSSGEVSGCTSRMRRPSGVPLELRTHLLRT